MKIETILSQDPTLRDGSMDKVQRLDGSGQMHDAHMPKVESIPTREGVCTKRFVQSYRR